MTFIESLELSKKYINDANVIRLINDNHHVLSISTISAVKDSSFGLIVETTNKAAALIMIKNGIKISDGSIVKVKVNVSFDPSQHHDQNQWNDERDERGDRGEKHKHQGNPFSNPAMDNHPFDYPHSSHNHDTQGHQTHPFGHANFRRGRNDHESEWLEQQARNISNSREHSQFEAQFSNLNI